MGHSNYDVIEECSLCRGNGSVSGGGGYACSQCLGAGKLAFRRGECKDCGAIFKRTRRADAMYIFDRDRCAPCGDRRAARTPYDDSGDREDEAIWRDHLAEIGAIPTW